MSDPAPQKNKWTVMIYLAGDNNLTDECVHALTQMKEVEGLDQEKICVLAQFDPKGGRLKTHRYKISPRSKQTALSGDFKVWVENIKKFDHAKYIDFEEIRRQRRGDPKPKKQQETNTGSPVTLFDFVTWCIEKYPAESYMLVLSGHGGGTEKGYLLRDEHPADALTMWEMQVALEAIKEAHGVEIDILGMDACLMTMAEVSHQLKGLAKVMVGSEGYSPIAGWPCKEVLTRMRYELNKLSQVNEPNLQARKDRERMAIANGVVEEYVNYYLDYSIGGLSVEQSALDLTKTVALTGTIDNLADVLCAEFPQNDVKGNKAFNHALVLSHWQAQSYNGEQFVDLYDFCALLREHYTKAEVVAACEAVLTATRSFVIRSCYSGPTYQYSRGVSIYFPWSEIDPDYRTVSFAFEGSKWLKFLENYIVATRRDPREPGANAYGDNSEPYAIRHTAGKHAPGKAMLPEILSMRNPPISAGVSECFETREAKETLLRGMADTWAAD